MSQQPFVSVYMACYNEGRFVSEAIRSVLNQSVEDFEFIIVDDASTDSSPDIIKFYSENDERIRVIRNKNNLGLNMSLNVALREVSGKFLAEVDSDDILHPQFLEIQTAFLERHPEYFLVGCGEVFIDEHGRPFGLMEPICDEQQLKRELENRYCLSTGIVYRNDGRRFYREKFTYAEDYDFILRLLSEGLRITNTPYYLYKWRKKPASMTSSTSGKMKLFAQKARQFYLQRLLTGRDDYESFDPSEILDIDVRKSSNPTVLMEEIKWSFRVNRFQDTRYFCKRFYETNGISSNILKYHVASLLGSRIIGILRRLKFKASLLKSGKAKELDFGQTIKA